MGANISTKIRERVRSRAIDKQIEADSRRLRLEQKVLLLGAPGSGKCTIIKQMKINYQNGYTPDELAAFRLNIYQTLVDSAKDVVLALHKIGLECVEKINKTYAAQILEYKAGSDESFRLAPDIANAIDSLRKDPIIATLMEYSSEFYLPDSASYFFSEVQRVARNGYIPSEMDVLRAEVKSAGIIETRFNLGHLSIRKWIHCFEAVTSIIFCTALSDYDQVLLEYKEQTRMDESLILFESVVNSRWFSRTSVILFLTKVDVFKAKLRRVPFQTFFPDYMGGADINKVVEYILWRFMQVNRRALMIHRHITDQTGTSNVQLVLRAIKETILQNALRDSGVL